MEMSIPVYVETLAKRQAAPPKFHCRPLFGPEVHSESEVLGRAMNTLVRKLKRSLDALGREPLHEALATAAYHPEFTSHTWKFHLHLRDRTLDCRYLFVVVEGLGRRIALTPSLPELRVEIADDEDAFYRTAESLADYFLRLKLDRPLEFFRHSRTSLTGKAWVTTVELDVATRQPTREEEKKRWAALWDETKMDGEAELDRVGRCLDHLYPDDLQRAVGRDAEVTRLKRLLAAADRRPVLLLGRRLAGKTTVLHECVWRRVKARKKQYSSKRNVWLISPGRLISGMSYLGQWENRWLSILAEAKRRDHVLYFDDLLGMYHAGISRDSDLCAADVLKPHVRRHELRMVAEMTPEALHVFQERDRGFADEFQILRVEETGEAETLPVLLEVARRLEARHRCRYDLEVLPAVTEVQRRYVPGAAFPGKAAKMLTRLAVKHTGAEVHRADVLEEFHQQTGLQLALLDADRRLPREEIFAGLAQRMVGQEAAIEAAADVVAIAKARLNAPDRPLGVLLFLGPTGVGKTECAKSLARYLYGDADKLLRLDMNEFVTAADAARLVGTRGCEDGLLTGPVRRRPFSVVLLDEIEKAHADVHDLLLQVTGEGRLTDAHGRTADFSGTIIVLTSNLGTREAARSTGFAAVDDSVMAPNGAAGDAAAAASGNSALNNSHGRAHDHHYVRAAERFFSPELFNRFDRVVPFRQLTRDELRRIAEHLMRDVFRRDGLVRRRTLLHVDPQAMQRVIDAGYHPRYGARALKRSIERQITRPVGQKLAEQKAERPTMVRVYPAAGGIVSLVDELIEAERRPPAQPPGDLDAAVAQVRARVRALEDEAARLKPRGGIAVGSLTPRDYRYFALREQLETVRGCIDAVEIVLADEREQGRRPMIAPSGPRSGRNESSQWNRGSQRQFLVNLHSTDDIEHFVREACAQPADLKSLAEAAWSALEGELALLEAMSAASLSSDASGSADSADSSSDRLVLLVRQLGDVGLFVRMLAPLARLADAHQLDCQSDWQLHQLLKGQPGTLTVSGAFAELLMSGEQGLHLLVGKREEISAMHVAALRLAEDETPQAVVERALADERDWIGSLQSGAAPQPGEPLPPGRVVRVYYPSGEMTDMRSGLTIPQSSSDGQLRRMLLAGLPRCANLVPCPTSTRSGSRQTSGHSPAEDVSATSPTAKLVDRPKPAIPSKADESLYEDWEVD